ncbi:Protein of unknown function (DUF732) [Mycolicibacterium chubuense NBB4]|uniref:DUF732 domain-containing protein n=1 Tax=Mycolicibacterium chubuense (strain NBB4) TaxID=710421 RepID=I4BLA3_MYCCN|nr:DUF732 domain-containing protein [Mycolicibacterium chubuense]AFM18060.1 Protein of unknown function (DUF732) [Mycolicibacterium chubuense NBB4]
MVRFSRLWRGVMPACVCVAVAGAAQLSLAPTASADTASYLAKLTPRYTSLTTDDLLSAGGIACGILGAGYPAPVAVDAIYREKGIALATANEIVSASVLDLGC